MSLQMIDKVENKSKESSYLYEPLDFYMLRIPSLPFELYLRSLESSSTEWAGMREEALSKLVALSQDKRIREVLAVASPSLLQSLPNLTNNTQPRKQDQAIKGFLRYFLRMTTRSTPYGLCSGVTTGSFGEESRMEVGALSTYRKRSRPDMEWLLKVVQSFEVNLEIVKQLQVQVNDATYINRSRAKLPYQTLYGQEDRKMEMASVRYTEVVERVFQLAKQPIQFQLVTDQLMKDYPEASEEQITQFVWQLFQQEFLISELRPPFMVESPFAYILDKLSAVQGMEVQKRQLQELANELCEYDQLSIGEGEEKYLQLTAQMKEIAEVKTPLQVDLAVRKKEVALSTSIREEVARTAECLWRLSPDQSANVHLESYRSDFLEKYGYYQEVPLLELLDEDQGLGAPATYQYPPSHRPYMPQPFSFSTKRESLLHQWMLESWVAGDIEIELTEEKIKQLEPENQREENASPSMELYFTVSTSSTEAMDQGDFQLVISPNSGSDGAGKSFGRFLDLFDSELEEQWKDIHRLEQEKEPDGAFAELVYLSTSGRSGNVSLSKNMRPYEIALGTNSSKESSETIDLSDLVVGCTQDGFYVKSKSLEKQVIPCTGHMLNHAGSPNVYRFLKEISVEGTRRWMSFKWGSLERAAFLPRLRIGRTIISPARWLLNDTMLDSKLESEAWFDALQAWRERWKVPRFIYLTVEDNRILLDLTHPLHAEELRRDFGKLRSDGQLVMTEMGYDPSDVWVEGEDGHFVMECVFPLIKKEKATKKEQGTRRQQVASRIDQLKDKPLIDLHERTSLPGSNWLFLKLYGLGSRQEEFIGGYLKNFVQQVQESGWSDYSYFMRYGDPETHIRLRFHGDPRELVTRGIPEIYEWAESLKGEGLLTRLVIDTYDPEVERYGGLELMNEVEQVFAADSIVVSEWIGWKRWGQIQMSEEILGAISVIHLLESFDLSFEEQLLWLDRRVNPKLYLQDFRKDRKEYLRLANSMNDWAGLQQDEEGQRILPLLNLRKEYVKRYAASLKQTEKQGRLYNKFHYIIASVIHLHLNRLVGLDGEKEDKVMTLARHTLRNLRHFRGE
ncbi:thiopeptide-type bacteriocin biosynthesis protein [Croceifilum oryzae]|uniref:Thiopeptide-type bacteriocin biosynthesis protein n=1 Tax=Croceifilum oryzae TaxID=1553429 RepID=A0AAJ1WSX9_9BACL|nr:lantibiotic dehydratase [Croceifilum oryzae]MDQ0417448.1 thiopeptide-type bacteriocin biosynthesis protein [Croceifilum oryzae]